MQTSFVAMRPSATARSTGTGTPGLTELEQDPQSHINEERSRQGEAKRTAEPIRAIITE